MACEYNLKTILISLFPKKNSKDLNTNEIQRISTELAATLNKMSSK